MLWKKLAGKKFLLFLGFFSCIAIFCIKIYRYCISPYLPAKCRYSPTCSEYALESYKNFNFFYATFLTIRRVLLCNPLGGSGYDPLPPTKHNKN